MPFITTRDQQSIYVRDIGSASSSDKPPILLLHGFAMQSIHWLPFVLPLSRNQRFIIPDLRGFGRSHHASYNQACILSNMADDLADIKDYYQLETIKIAGISMGAFVALQYQLHYGDKHVSRYLHIDQSPKCLNDKDWQWGLFGKQQGPRLSDARALVESLKPYIVKRTAYNELPEALRKSLWSNLGDFYASALSKLHHKKLAKKICQQESMIKHLMPVENWPVYIQCLNAYLDQGYNMLEDIKALRAPMSLLVGLKSEMYPCGGQLRIADYHQNCEVIPFKNSGHTPLIDQPFQFLNELRRFSKSA